MSNKVIKYFVNIIMVIIHYHIFIHKFNMLCEYAFSLLTVLPLELVLLAISHNFYTDNYVFRSIEV